MLTIWLPQGFDKSTLRNFLIVYFYSKNIFCSWDNFWFTGDSLVDKGSKEKILDMIGRACIDFNVSGFVVFLASNNSISFLLYFAFNFLGDQWPYGIQSLMRIHYEFLKILNKMFFDFMSKDKEFFNYYFYLCVWLSVSWVKNGSLIDKKQ